MLRILNRKDTRGTTHPKSHIYKQNKTNLSLTDLKETILKRDGMPLFDTQSHSEK